MCCNAMLVKEAKAQLFPQKLYSAAEAFGEAGRSWLNQLCRSFSAKVKVSLLLVPLTLLTSLVMVLLMTCVSVPSSLGGVLTGRACI